MSPASPFHQQQQQQHGGAHHHGLQTVGPAAATAAGGSAISGLEIIQQHSAKGKPILFKLHN